MKKHSLFSAFIVLVISISHAQINFSDNFNNGLKPEWRWLDQDNSAWNLNGGRLNMKRYVGHGFFQTPNDRLPVLYYPNIPYTSGISAQTKVGFDVDRKYGQAGLLVYYDKENYAKLVIEYWWEYGIRIILVQEVNGIKQNNIVLSGSDNVPYGSISVELKIDYTNGKFTTYYRSIGSSNWTQHCVINSFPNRGNINVGLFSQADSGSNDWAWFDDFSLNIPGAGLSTPSISSQPSSTTVAQGGTVTFNVQASGNPVPTYQWYKNNNVISGANSSSYTINNAQSSDAGNYRVVVSNSQGSVTSNTVNLTVNAPISQGPYPGGDAIALPGTIQAENYDLGGSGVAFSDNTSGNTGGQYRNDNVDIEACTEGGYNVGWIENGEWLEYTVSPTSGSYNISLRYASIQTPGTVKMLLDGITLGTFSLSSTGGWQNWQNATLTNVNINGGTNKILRLELGGGLNLNSVQFTQVVVDNTTPSAPANLSASAAGTTSITLSWTASTDNVGVTGYDIYNGANLVGSTAANSFRVNNLMANTAYSFTVKAKDAAGNISAASNTATATTLNTPPSGQSPYLGAPVALPGKVEAENYDLGGSGIAFNDFNTGNTGGAYRNDNVDIEACAEGGYNVGWTEANEWLEYTIAPTAGTYTINFRYASGMDNTATVKLSLDGVTLGTASVPNTGGWQTYKTISFANVQLTDAASAVLRLEFSSWGSNINFIEFVKNNTVTSPVTGTVTRETWSNVGGTLISEIPVNNTPTSTSILTSLEIPVNAADNYGTRIRGYIVPSTSGTYNFYISGDDYCQFWLSSTAEPAGKSKVAEVSGWTNSREWAKYPSQKSANISLAAGTKYYFEILHKEGAGGDNVAVGWTGPGITSIAVIGSANISMYTSGSGKVEQNNVITSNPLSIYPVPFNDELNIVSELPIVNINVLNVFGENMIAFTGNHSAVVVNTQNLVSGYYIVVVTTNDGNIVRKKIIK
jgi:regulation of enolase protein 1 (concanavalin A-like superfamily)